MENQDANNFVMKMPDPPAYYKLFINGPNDLKPPSLKLLHDNH